MDISSSITLNHWSPPGSTPRPTWPCSWTEPMWAGSRHRPPVMHAAHGTWLGRFPEGPSYGTTRGAPGNWIAHNKVGGHVYLQWLTILFVIHTKVRPQLESELRTAFYFSGWKNIKNRVYGRYFSIISSVGLQLSQLCFEIPFGKLTVCYWTWL